MRTQPAPDYGPTMHSMSSSTSRASAFEPRVVERSRGTAHPAGHVATRDRVARSLVLRPDAGAGRRGYSSPAR
jgi:hypothetical protein